MNKPKLDDKKAIWIYNKLKHGEENATKRDTLAIECKMSYRRIRMYLHYLRSIGMMVIDSQQGLFKPSEDITQAERELDAYIKRELSYIQNFQRNITAAKKYRTNMRCIQEEL